MRRQARYEDESTKGAPEWIVTFTDMISLLVTFFVLLMTYSSLDPRDFVKIGSLLDTHPGVLRQNEGDIAPDFTEADVVSNQHLLRGARTPHSRPPQHLFENLTQMGQKETPEHRAVDLTQTPDGLRIAFGASSSFDPGSADVPPELSKSLGQIARVLEHYSFTIVVEGFTDGGFQSTPRYPTAELLSLHRARNAARAMLEVSGLSPKLVQVAGLGSENPRADELTAEGRRLNRRVELRLVALPASLEAMLESQRGRDDREER